MVCHRATTLSSRLLSCSCSVLAARGKLLCLRSSPRTARALAAPGGLPRLPAVTAAGGRCPNAGRPRTG